MPEGHTLHVLAGRLEGAFAGRPVAASSPQGRFADGAALLHGQSLSGAQAWGKHLFAEFSGERWLHVHLGLIGSFPVRPLPPAWHGSDHDRMPSADVPVTGQVRLRLLGHHHVADLRGPNVCGIVPPEHVAQVTGRLGPDPLREDADPDRAWSRISRSGRPIGELLMDQEVLAGVGNVYRCEVLFRHRVDPFRSGRELRRRTWQAIWEDLTVLMRLGVTHDQILTMEDQVDEALATASPAAASPAWDGPVGGPLDRPPDGLERRYYLYRRAGEPCRVCGSAVRSARAGGRTLYWCGRCQRRR